MIRGGVGHSTASNPKTAAAEATAEALSRAGLARAEGAFCFASTAYGAAYPMILRTVASEAHTKEVAGCSSIGVVANEHEIETGASLCVMVVGGDSIRAKRFFVPTLRGRSNEVASEIANAVRPALGANNLLCLFADTYNVDAERLLPAIARELPQVKIAGGGASEDGSIGETFQFCGDTVSTNSVSGMLLAGDFDVTIASSVACTPIGPAHRVTAARDNVLIELDGRPACEVFKEAAGALAQDLRRAAAFVFLAVPVDATVGAQHLERGRYLVRNIVGVSEEHGVIAVAHHADPGDTVGFLLRDGARARDDLKATLEDLSALLPNPPAFGIYFDCVSRGSGLYQIPGHDSAYIRQYLGDVPVAGFFTGFEIGPVGERTELLQYTGVLALVSGRKP